VENVQSSDAPETDSVDEVPAPVKLFPPSGLITRSASIPEPAGPRTRHLVTTPVMGEAVCRPGIVNETKVHGCVLHPPPEL
jgi:hypothetical protein